MAFQPGTENIGKYGLSTTLPALRFRGDSRRMSQCRAVRTDWNSEGAGSMLQQASGTTVGVRNRAEASGVLRHQVDRTASAGRQKPT